MQFARTGRPAQDTPENRQAKAHATRRVTHPFATHARRGRSTIRSQQVLETSGASTRQAQRTASPRSGEGAFAQLPTTAFHKHGCNSRTALARSTASTPRCVQCDLEPATNYHLTHPSHPISTAALCDGPGQRIKGCCELHRLSWRCLQPLARKYTRA
ncbi:hypothetical protein TRVL_09468 [Trypanosoma vivax]|nr:hypothetical protein TRVL_09468 [Trypanosoma vivax]